MLSMLLFATMAGAQPDKRISVNFNDEDATQAMRRIEEMAGVRIQFNYEELSFPVTYKADRQTALEVVSQIVKSHGLQVQAEGDYLIISHEGKPVTTGRTVKGRVIDEKGQPLVGATIRVEETGKGTVSNEQGEYELMVTASSGDVVVSYIGYETRHIAATRFVAMRRIVFTPTATMSSTTWW